MTLPTVVSREEWLAARKDLLVKEKAATRARDALKTERRRLPMVRVEKGYVFDTPEGKRSLLDLFEGRRQLIVYHFMFDPSWGAGCPSCLLLVDSIGHLSHLHARNTSLTVVSRVALEKLQAYRERMGWTVPWVSSCGSDFNYDFHATIDPSVAAVATARSCPGSTATTSTAHSPFPVTAGATRAGASAVPASCWWRVGSSPYCRCVTEIEISLPVGLSQLDTRQAASFGEELHLE
jgi:predicted dithiol-disulfide oxidoreductase (DUF899 family)